MAAFLNASKSADDILVLRVSLYSRSLEILFLFSGVNFPFSGNSLSL
jgi:hypothetical protein